MASYKKSKCTSLTHNSDGTMDVEIETPKEKIKISVNKILLSVGKRANTSKLQLDNAGIATSTTFLSLEIDFSASPRHEIPYSNRGDGHDTDGGYKQGRGL